MRQSAIITPIDLRHAKKRKAREIKIKEAKRQRTTSFFKRTSSKNLPISSISNRLWKRKNKIKIKKYEKEVIPRNFSLLDAPENVLKTIYNITQKISHPKCRTFFVDYRKCQEYSLGSEVLFGVLGRTIKFQKQKSNSTVLINGAYPQNEQHLEIVRDVGIVKEIGADTEHREFADLSGQIIFSRERENASQGSAFAQDDKNKASEDFVEYINQCLRKGSEKELTETANRKLSSCIGELLDNCERHAHKNQDSGKWFIRGHVNVNQDKPCCEIAIFNFGQTIKETYDNLPQGHFSYEIQVMPYVRKHENINNLTTESLMIVASLQGKVSCKNQGKRDTCGTGTIELLELFQTLSDELNAVNMRSNKSSSRPKMTIISGNTCIFIDGKYRLKSKDDDNIVRDVLDITNDDIKKENMIYPLNNDSLGLAAPPDYKVVKSMGDGFFPGFMLNIRFSLETGITESQLSKFE